MKVLLELSKEIYNYEKILHSIAAFSDYAYIHINDAPDYYILEFSESKYDLELTKSEFENYLIDESNDLE